MTDSSCIQFNQLNLPQPLLQALTQLGYETPSPIQAEAIPILLQGRDLIGQAQTGTGKTAAFALPLLARIVPGKSLPQLLVLAPTRELAIQVAEAFQSYARYLDDFHVLPIYGGQSYSTQLRQLKRGAHVVVGTPGRVMDHIRRGTLVLDELQALVLDEADEMLRMGFIDDVEWILKHTPQQRQIALFSATMPKVIRTVAQTYLHDPAQIKIAAKTSTASTIRQRYWLVQGLNKLDALTRILEIEQFDGIIIFVRTKTATIELSEKLAARGYRAAALNGDIQQRQREAIVEKLKQGQLDIIIATDVAARGLDVERISHVINYDIPYDTEAYIHRIGRTGRAGRDGQAILFVAPRERRLLSTIERSTKQPIEAMPTPSAKQVNEQRIQTFKRSLIQTLEEQDLSPYSRIINEFLQEHTYQPIELAAALAFISQGSDSPFLLNEAEPVVTDNTPHERKQRARKPDYPGSSRAPSKGRDRANRPSSGESDCYRIEVGREHNVKPGHIVGAIANEADIDSRHIGHISIFEDYSTVDLPKHMPKQVLALLKKTRVMGRRLEIKLHTPDKPAPGTYKPRPSPRS